MNTWAYVPQSVQMHPLSRFGQEDIVIHVVFEDGDGFECRAVGTLELTLSGTGFKNTTKTINLANFGTNRHHFDKLTRTYLFRFNQVPDDLSKLRVLVTFSPELGTTLRASGTVEK